MPVTRVGDGEVGDEASDAVELGPDCDPCPVGSTDEERGENSIPLKQAFNGFAGELISPDCGTR